MSEAAWVATRKGLFKIERKPSGWDIASAALLGDHVSMVLPDARDGSMYAGLSLGHFGAKMKRSRDGGNTWAEAPVPVYPPMPEGAPPEIDPIRKTEVKWDLSFIWSLETGGPQRPGVLWCGTIPGGLFRSDDGGDSWRMIRSLWDNPKRKAWVGGGMDRPGIHSICVHPSDPDHVSVGVSCGGVWVTRDGGDTWANLAHGMRAEYVPPELQYDPNTQDAHRLVQCPANPDAMWVQHHNGIFRSTDGSVSWTEITPVARNKEEHVSAFGFAVAVHPKDGDTAWFVPAVKDEKRFPAEGHVVVSRTSDGGKSFDVLRRGLPQRHAYDLVFRHCLDIDETGNRLMFGSTTGSLWVSEDGGESWQTISEHLPPIYCVRFA